MPDPIELLVMPPAPPARAAPIQDAPPASEWHALSWRPAGSMPLSERWLRAGETRSAPKPPGMRRRRSL